MKHPVRWILGLSAVVLVAVIAFGAWYVFGGSAPAKPKLSSSAPVDAGGPATPDGTWSVKADPKNTYVGYRMTEVFAGDVVHKEAVGRTPAVTGNMTVNGLQITATKVQGDLRQLSSDRLPRDNYIHTHGIESDKFPFAVFTLTSPITLPAAPQKGVKISVTATGTLTLHGVTKTITLPLDARWNGSTIEATGNAPIVLADYNIEPPNTGVVKVDNNGSFDVSLVFGLS